MVAVGKLTSKLVGPSGRARDNRFLDAATAAAALIAEAGGEKDAKHHKKIRGLLHSAEDLLVFDEQVIDRSFNLFTALIRRGGNEGRNKALMAVSSLGCDLERARAVVGLGAAIACLNGKPSPAESDMIQTLSVAAKVPSRGSNERTTDHDRATSRCPRVITLASAKGGTGKSTVAIHLVIGLLKHGKKVGSIDLDGGQGTLSRFLANRAARERQNGQALAMPRHWRIGFADTRDPIPAGEVAHARLRDALSQLSDCAYVVIDTPAFDCSLARRGCEHADIVITPLNDSLLDLDTVARIDPRRRTVLGPSEYCRFMWEENDRRITLGRRPIDWVIMRNRLGSLDTRNNRELEALLAQLGRRIGFRLENGFQERVVYRELFLEGLTLLDLVDASIELRLNESRLNARREIDRLLHAVPGLA